MKITGIYITRNYSDDNAFGGSITAAGDDGTSISKRIPQEALDKFIGNLLADLRGSAEREGREFTYALKNAGLPALEAPSIQL